ncbi:MAG TPA: ZIP family metal transporter [Bacillota bacterium]|nr:ZIP family metal transporter [Bacillota bacterium]
MEKALVVVAGLLIGVVGTGLGGLITAFMGRPGDKVLSGVLGFAGGIMLSVVFVDLIPEALEIGGYLATLLGVVIGILMIMSLDLIFSHKHLAQNGDISQANDNLKKTGIILGVGIALHNIPEGLAIGVGYMADSKLGYTIALTMLIQNIPEGMAMAAPLYVGGTRGAKVILMTAMSGLPMGLGVLIALLFGSITPTVLAFGLGFAAGAMLFIVLDEMMPSAIKMSQGRAPVTGTLLGILLGVTISFFG